LDDPNGTITIASDSTRRERREASNLLARPPGVPAGARNPATKLSRGLTGWLIFVAVAALLFVWLRHQPSNRPRRAARSRPEPAVALSAADEIAIGTLATGVACIGLFFVVAVRWARESRSRWEGRQSLAFDHRGVTRHRPGHTHLLRWSGIRGFEEGPSVFVLRSDKLQGIIVPKRLLASDEQRDRLRELLRHHTIRPAVPIPLGFEVGQS
jgi:hypothetical protein